MAETELKFTLDNATAERLQARLMQLASPRRPPEERALHSIYFDTKSHRLKDAGVALRLRRDGTHWVQTVKAKATNRNGLQIAEEAECEVPEAQLSLKRIPDKTLRKSVKALIGKRDLQPVCETEIGRMLLTLHDGEGAAVEVALDRGHIRAGTQAREFRELELELKSGDAAALYALAGDLLPTAGWTPRACRNPNAGICWRRPARLPPISPRAMP